MNRQRIKPGQVIIHNLNRPLTDRLKSRKIAGPYIVTPSRPENDYFFYYDSDFALSLRTQFCDDIAQSIKHRGWFCDSFEDQTIRGIVAQLPKGRGFLAGWTMGESMGSVLERHIYPDGLSAALAADDIARYVAEREREYQEENES